MVKDRASMVKPNHRMLLRSCTGARLLLPLVGLLGWLAGAGTGTDAWAAGVVVPMGATPQLPSMMSQAPDDRFLRKTLAAIYNSNDQLQAARATANAVNDRFYGAIGQWLPSVVLQGTMATGKAEVGDKSGSDHPTSKSITVTQPIWRANLAPGIMAARHSDLAERSRLLNTEQQVLLSGVTVYFNLAQSAATLELQVSNEHLLSTQLQSVEQQLHIGTLTATDVAQARAALQSAVAQRSAAAAALKAAQASFVQVVQSEPIPTPPVDLPLKLLPATEEEAVALAIRLNPQLRAADYDSETASDQEFAAWASLGPSVSLVGSYTESKAINISNAAAGSQTTKTTQVMGVLSWPIWDSGVTYSAIAAQRQVAKASRYQYKSVLATVTQQTVAVFGQLVSSREQVKAFEAVIKANTIALNGTREEVQIGTKSILDLLNAEQALLNSQVSLVQAQYRMQLAAYQLLAATGGLTASSLGLEVEPR